MSFDLIFHKRKRRVAQVAIGTGSSNQTNHTAAYPWLSKEVEFMAYTSEDQIPSLKNIKKERKIAITRVGCGKNQEEGRKLWEQKGSKMIEDVQKVCEENPNIEYLDNMVTAGGGTSSVAGPEFAKEVKSQGIVKHVLLRATLPSEKEDPVVIQNSLNFLKEAIKLVDNGSIDGVEWIQNGKIVKNDTGDYRLSDLQKARNEAIILQSYESQVPYDLSDHYFRFFLLQPSPKYRTATRGLARKQLTRKHNGSFASEYIADLTAKAIKENWLGATLSEQCRIAYLVIRADPKLIDTNNKTIIENVAREYLPPKAVVSVGQCPVKRAQSIEIAGLFIGVKTDFAKKSIERLNEIATTEQEEDETSAGSVWESLGFDHDPNAEGAGV